jgi:type IV secretion system protein VirB5
MKKAISIVIFILVVGSNSQVLATISVIDSANLANSAKQVAYWAEQLAAMRNQLDQAKEQYRTITGSRGLGDILNNPALRQYLPLEYQNIYDAANSDLSSPIATITAAQNLIGSINDMQKSVETRQRRNAITDKAVMLKGYEGTKLRSNQIDSLMQKVNSTQDLKGIGELQARIAIEQASIQNEIVRLQIIEQLQHNEARLLEEQKSEMSRRILNSNNKEMPRIQ